jgi:hypothetical protein
VDIVNQPFAMKAINITQPSGGLVLVADQLYKIKWDTYLTLRPVARVKIFLSTDGGNTWEKLAGRRKDREEFNWIVSRFTTPKLNCLIRINLFDKDDRILGSDTTAQPFVILPTAPVE